MVWYYGDHGDLDEFDKEQPADVYDGVRGDVLVVDDVHDDRGDLGGDGVHDTMVTLVVMSMILW